MNKRGRYRAVFIVGVLCLLSVGAAGLRLRSEQRQAAINRQLIAALGAQDFKKALLLVNMGADPNAYARPLPPPSLRLWWDYLWHRSMPSHDDDSTAFLIACGNEQDRVGIFCGTGLDFDYDGPDCSGFYQGHDAPDLVRTMLRHGANIHVRNAYGDTPLHWACHRSNLGTIGVLLDNGADINERTDEGKTPLMIVCDAPSPHLVSLLLAHGADVNARDKQGATALQQVRTRIPKQSEETAKEERAAIAKGALPPQYAHSRQRAPRHEILALLKQAGAKK